MVWPRLRACTTLWFTMSADILTGGDKYRVLPPGISKLIFHPSQLRPDTNTLSEPKSPPVAGDEHDTT